MEVMCWRSKGEVLSGEENSMFLSYRDKAGLIFLSFG